VLGSVLYNIEDGDPTICNPPFLLPDLLLTYYCTPDFPILSHLFTLAAVYGD